MEMIKETVGKYHIVAIGNFGILREVVATITKTDNTNWEVKMADGRIEQVAAYYKEDAAKVVARLVLEADETDCPAIGYTTEPVQ